jgi:hypothetical protein
MPPSAGTGQWRRLTAWWRSAAGSRHWRVPWAGRWILRSRTPTPPLHGSRAGTPCTGREQPDPIFGTGFVFRQSRPDISAQKRPPFSLIDGYPAENL